MKGIALIGPKHSGKTTAATIAVEQHDFVKLALADPLKDSAVVMLNAWLVHMNREPFMTRELLDKHKDEYFVPLLQWLGTEWARQFLMAPTIWIDAFLASAEAAERPVVCDDCRYLNEANALSEAGFVTVRIKRPEDERQASLNAANAGGILGHASETELEQIETDLTLNNVDLTFLDLGMAHICEMVEFPEEPSVMEFAA